MNKDVELELVKASPVWIVAMCEWLTSAMPVMILFLTVVYAVLQIVLIIPKIKREYSAKFKGAEHESAGT